MLTEVVAQLMAGLLQRLVLSRSAWLRKGGQPGHQQMTEMQGRPKLHCSGYEESMVFFDSDFCLATGLTCITYTCGLKLGMCAPGGALFRPKNESTTWNACTPQVLLFF